MPSAHLEAAFYRNSVVHFLLNRAIAELVLVHVDEQRAADAVVDGWEEALRIRDLLKFEFFFARKREFEHELREELTLIDPDWERRAGEPGAAWEALERADVLLAPRVLASFLEAYLVVAERLAARDPSDAGGREGVPRRVPRRRRTSTGSSGSSRAPSRSPGSCSRLR